MLKVSSPAPQHLSFQAPGKTPLLSMTGRGQAALLCSRPHSAAGASSAAGALCSAGAPQLARPEAARREVSVCPSLLHHAQQSEQMAGAGGGCTPAPWGGHSLEALGRCSVGCGRAGAPSDLLSSVGKLDGEMQVEHLLPVRARPRCSQAGSVQDAEPAPATGRLGGGTSALERGGKGVPGPRLYPGSAWRCHTAPG